MAAPATTYSMAATPIGSLFGDMARGGDDVSSIGGAGNDTGLTGDGILVRATPWAATTS